MAKRFKAALALVIACLGVALLVAATPAWAADTPSDAPYTEKMVTSNGDGTYTVKLSVMGRSQQTVESKGARVIVVQDISASMREDVVGYTYTKVTSTSPYGTYYGLVDGAYVEIRQSLFSGGWYYFSGGGTKTYDTSAGIYTRKQTSSISRINVAKNCLAALASDLLNSGSDIQMSLICFGSQVQNTNGIALSNPSNVTWFSSASDFTKQVNSISVPSSNGTNWEAALLAANQVAQSVSGMPVYIIFCTDGDPTYYVGNNGGTAGNGSSFDQTAYDRAVTAAKARPANVKGYNVVFTGTSGSDGETRSRNFATDTSGSFFKGEKEDELTDALSQIAQTITTNVDYQGVTVTDSLSENVSYVLGSGQQPVFTYTKDGEPWEGEDVPQASLSENGQVVWSLGSDYPLESGVTYTVSFPVTLSDTAIQKALANGGSISGLPTNGEAYCTYHTITTKDDGSDPVVSEPKQAPYESGQVDVVLDRLTVSKQVTGNMGNVDQAFNFQVSGLTKGTYYVQGAGSDAAQAQTVGEDGTLSLSLKSGQSAVIYSQNGVANGTVTVAEIRDDVTNMTTSVNGAVLTGTGGSNPLSYATTVEFTAEQDALSTPFVNNSEAAPIVGFSDNATPFLVLMTVAIAGAGAAGLHAFARSREE